MGFSTENCLLTIREQMGIRTNGDLVGKFLRFRENGKILIKKLVKQQGFREQNVLFREMGSSKTLLTIREQMGIRTNGVLEQKSLHKKRKWVPICSRAYCTDVDNIS